MKNAMALTELINSRFDDGWLHSLVVWAAAAFRHHPINNLVRVRNVARLAMHAVRGANLQLHAAFRFLGHFVHGCATKRLPGIPVLLAALGCAPTSSCRLA